MAAQSSASKLGASLISARPNLLQQPSHTTGTSTASAPDIDPTVPRGLSLETKLLARQVLHADQNLESNNTSHPFSRSMDWLLSAVTECEDPKPLATDRERLVESVKSACDKQSPEKKSDGHGPDTHTMAEEVVDIWALPQMRKTAI
ncbi:hypothetical protein D6C84_09314 [Aureobasidium pullulans]|uniref:Uncharacterized protein n=1 Tax=Aureobasidium pullulans TaxID=5580 RepID=A0A4S9X732_AURPU|nr:hypothetical protein D6C84_09314 [Aureobasidium pullulans]